MLNLPMALLFTAMTFLSWGVYGILLHEGQERLGHSSLRSFIGVGIAYFLIAVLGAAVLLSTRKEKGVWSLSGILLSLFAGSVGALGALGVLLARTSGQYAGDQLDGKDVSPDLAEVHRRSGAGRSGCRRCAA
jgi:hypothetical protein